MSRKLLNAALLAACVVPAVAPAAQPGPSKSAVGNADQIQRGRYLVKITGCNDCHTPGYGLSGGKVPESLWLTGDKLGWRGPWGTTYAANLRLYMHGLSEAAWVKTAKNLKARPPMPSSFALNQACSLRNSSSATI